MTDVRILRLTKRCPECGAPPGLRTFPTSKELLDDRDPQRVVITYQCQVRTCLTIYAIRVKDFIDAA